MQNCTDPLNRTDSKASEYMSVSNSLTCPVVKATSNYVNLNIPHLVNHRSLMTLVPHVGIAPYSPT